MLGTAAAGLLPRGSGLLALALGAAGVAWGGRLGTVTAAAAAGLGLAWACPPETPAGRFPDPARPAVVVGRPEGRWRPERFGWSAVLRTQVVRQGERVEPWRRRVRVTAPRRPAPAGRLRLTGYLRPAASFGNPGARGRDGWRLGIKSDRFVEVVTPARGGLRALRDGLERRLGGARPDTPGRCLARALLFGDPAALPDRVVRSLRRAGLGHLLAVSGLHVGMVAAAGRCVGALLPRAARWLPGIGAAAAYLLLVGPRPAILRASAMAVLVIVAVLSARPPQALAALALAAAAITVADPQAVNELGFRLTILATLGIVLSGPLLADRWTALPTGLGRGLAATVAAQLATLPWALPAFHLLSPFAPLLNLVAIPWTAAALGVILAWAAARGLGFGPAEALLARALEVVARPYFGLAELPAGRLGALPLTADFGACLVLVAGVGAVLRRPRSALGGSLLLAGVALVAGPGAAPEPRLVLLDVGQGESILLQDRDRVALLDGGGWRSGDLGGRVLLPALARLGVRRLDAVILSHGDVDHCGGLADLSSYLAIREVWTAPGWREAGCARRLAALPGARLRPLWRGRTARLGCWSFDVLHPRAGERLTGNDRSLVLTARCRGTSVLLTGDVEASGERRLLPGLEERHIDLLKVAHHGSRTSSHGALLSAVSPRLAVISAGRENPYGHPAPEVLARLRGRGIPLLRTDRSGQVRVRLLDRGRWRIELPAAPG